MPKILVGMLGYKVMATAVILSLLVAERDRLNTAIAALQGGVRRRGRPPKNETAIGIAPVRKRRGMSAAARKAQSERMKARWAARRRAAKKG